jgi:internalin A
MPSKPRTFLASPDGVNRLNAAKARLNLTTAAIAEQAGVSADTVRRLWHPERGKRVSAASVFAIAKVLKLSPQEITSADEWQDGDLLAEAARRIKAVILTGSTELDLSRLQLTEVPAKLGKLVNLTELYLFDNQLTEIPAELGNLVNLTRLFLDQNQLGSVPEFIRQLTKLTRIDLNDNVIIALPEFLKSLPNLQAVFLHGNQQLGIPNEILGPTWEEVDQGASPTKAQDVLSYYFRILTDRQPLNEAKLILVGFGNVGKTSLVNRLIHNTFDPDSKKTEGIQITQWGL